MALSEKARTALKTVILKFQTGDLSPLVDIALIKYDPSDSRPMAHWSLANRTIAYAQTESLDCRGFKQWQAADRHVTAGSHAAYILGPRTIKDDDDPDRMIVTGFFSIPVFPDCATEPADPDGSAVIESCYTPATLPPLVDVAKRFDLSIAYSPPEIPAYAGTSARGYYRPAAGHIQLHTHHPKTWFHELAHAAHHRIDGLDAISADEETAKHAETVAEFTACVLMHLYGYGDYSGNAWNYIAALHPDPITALYKALSSIEKVLDLILADS